MSWAAISSIERGFVGVAMRELSPWGSICHLRRRKLYSPHWRPSFRFAIFWRTAASHPSLFLDAKKRSVVGRTRLVPKPSLFRNNANCLSFSSPLHHCQPCLQRQLKAVESICFSRRNNQRSVSSRESPTESRSSDHKLKIAAA